MGRILHVLLVNITLCDGRPVHSLVGLLECLTLVGEVCAVDDVVTASGRHDDSVARCKRETERSELKAQMRLQTFVAWCWFRLVDTTQVIYARSHRWADECCVMVMSTRLRRENIEEPDGAGGVRVWSLLHHIWFILAPCVLDRTSRGYLSET